jgi:superoxide dismutase, Cu-Zn family
MKKLLLSAVCIFALQNLALAADADVASSIPPPITKAVDVKTSDGKDAGKVILTQTKEGVLLHLDLKNLTPGEHAYHIHEKGICDAPKFEGAGGHLNPEGHPHGYMQENGPHDGDMPNIFVAQDGTVNAHILNTRVSLDPEDTSRRGQLMNADGSAIVVHAGPDDYSTQPTGAAGDRVACGIIAPVK